MIDENCIFCRVATGEIPAHFVYQDNDLMVIMDINPLAPGHCLLIPKYHAKYLHELPLNYGEKVGKFLVLIAKALGAENYNILQNNGKLAHQDIPHVHFHIIPKPGKDGGLGLRMPGKQASSESLSKLANEIKEKLDTLL